jgi:hypothetical protein
VQVRVWRLATQNPDQAGRCSFIVRDVVSQIKRSPDLQVALPCTGMTPTLVCLSCHSLLSLPLTAVSQIKRSPDLQVALPCIIISSDHSRIDNIIGHIAHPLPPSQTGPELPYQTSVHFMRFTSQEWKKRSRSQREAYSHATEQTTPV